MKTSYFVLTATLLATSNCAVVYAGSFTQTNLVSDIPGMAQNYDQYLKNPWGMSFSMTSPIWVSDQASDYSTLYHGDGTKITTLMPSIPPSGVTPNGPTGQVFNSAPAGNFLDGASPASFIFATLAGTIDAWNGSNGSMAAKMFTSPTPHTTYTGLAIGNIGTNFYLYAAAFGPGGGIQVLNSSFAPVTFATGAFTDPMIPTGFFPFNVQNIGGKLYVEYAQFDPANPALALPGGFVDVYNPDGALTQQIRNTSLDAPWGVAIAPSTWGSLANDLLVGNFGNGEINAFDSSGNLVTTLDGTNGQPIKFEDFSLWGLAFGNSSADPNALYFAAGIHNQADGLFGTIQPVPEPATWLLLGLGFAGLFAMRLRRARLP